MTFVLIGDVVGSKAVNDRVDLNRVLLAALAALNDEPDQRWRPTTAVRITVGDEFQGAFGTLGAAVRATLRLRLACRPYDLRFGLGRGATTVLSRDPWVEDGPAWWAARAAIEDAAARQRRAASRSIRTVLAFDTQLTTDPAVAAALLLRDEVIASCDDRDLSVLAGMLAGMSQDAIAHREGITPSAVSQRVRRRGLVQLRDADTLLGEL